MDDTDRFRLIAGPYLAPFCRVGSPLFCASRDREVIVGGITDAPIPWPRARKSGKPSLILCGDLCRAVRVESELAVAHHWGVGVVTVWAWRRALGVGRVTTGTSRLHRDYAPDKILTPESREKSDATARRPESRAKQSENKRGQPAHPNTAEALRESASRPWSETRRKAMTPHLERLAEGRRGQAPIPGHKIWEPAEDAMLGTAIDREIASRLGRTVAAVRSRRKNLGIPAYKDQA